MLRGRHDPLGSLPVTVQVWLGLHVHGRHQHLDVNLDRDLLT